MYKTSNQIADEVIEKVAMPFRPAIKNTKKLVKQIEKYLKDLPGDKLLTKNLARERANLKNLEAMQKMGPKPGDI